RLALGVGGQQPWKTFQEFIAAAKAAPGKYNYGASSDANSIAFGTIFSKLGIELTKVNYAGTAQSQTSTISGETHVNIFTESSAVGFATQVRLLAMTGAERSPYFPDVPTFDSLGIPYVPAGTFTLNARRGTPQAVLDKLYQAAVRALNNPELKP